MVININLTDLPTNVNILTGGIEPIFEFIRRVLTNVAGFVRDLITKFAPGYESVILLVLSFLAGWYLGSKSRVASWLLIGTIIFLVLRYI